MDVWPGAVRKRQTKQRREEILGLWQLNPRAAANLAISYGLSRDYAYKLANARGMVPRRGENNDEHSQCSNKETNVSILPELKKDVLDHGFVRLVDSMGTDLSVVRAARVSYDAAWRAGEDEKSDHRLIRYLWKHAHTSPFEHVSFTFEVKAPIFILRQWHRHRTWSYSEISARYAELPEEFYVPKLEHIGVQSKDNKQARVISDDFDKTRAAQIENIMWSSNARAFDAYQVMIKAGVPRELARTVLPVATYSHMFATIDLLNLLKFMTLRSHSHAQYEMRVYSVAMMELIEPIVPVCVAAWRELTK